MQLWIDASALSPITVFGMGLVERHLRAAARVRPCFERICIDTGGGPRPELPADLVRSLPLCWAEARGTAGERLAAFMAARPGPVLAVSGDAVVDARLYAHLAELSGTVAARDNGTAILRLEPAAAGLWPAELDSLPAIADALADAGAAEELTQDRFPMFIRGLRRMLPFYLFTVRDTAQRARVERFMFRANYKGSTDFFTKYVYPFIVWQLVRPLARLRVHPNWVTGLNVLFAVLAIPAFATGHYVAGFLFAYGMSVLDSVDGKLARLTFTDSKLGTLMDHGLDLIHPPLWYLAWAWALAAGNLYDPVVQAGILLAVVYILDRLCLKVYSVNFRRGLHAHARIDGLVRTFIARRNMNLPLFTAGVVLGYGREAFYLIVVWQLATLIWHAGRVAWILNGTAPARPGLPVRTS